MSIQQFPPISKADWLRQITKDLKDKPLEVLEWHPNESLSISPLVHAEDFSQAPLPLGGTSNTWEIDEAIVVTDPVAANKQALEALEGGAEGLCLKLDAMPDQAAFQQLFAGIHLDFIGLHFSGTAVAANPGMLLSLLEASATEKGLSTTVLRGSLAYNPLRQAAIVDWRYLADLLAFGREKFPQFSLIQVSAETDADPWDLSGLLRNTNVYLQKLSDAGLTPAQTAAAMQFILPVGKSYFLEIARLRAFKILWFNVLKAWNAPLSQAQIRAEFDSDVYTDDLYTNMIRATTMAMSAVIGGAQYIKVLPYDAGREQQAKYPASFGRRIARNVQHLLKMESGLDQIPDPAAGSYYVENLTRMIAERSWAGMLKLQEA